MQANTTTSHQAHFHGVPTLITAPAPAGHTFIPQPEHQLLQQHGRPQQPQQPQEFGQNGQNGQTVQHGQFQHHEQNGQHQRAPQSQHHDQSQHHVQPQHHEQPQQHEQSEQPQQQLQQLPPSSPVTLVTNTNTTNDTTPRVARRGMSDKLRLDICRALLRGDKAQMIALQEQCSLRTVYKVKENLMTYGSTRAPASDKPLGRRCHITEQDADALHVWLRNVGWKQHKEMVQWLQTERGVTISQSSVSRFLARRGWTRSTFPGTETGRGT